MVKKAASVEPQPPVVVAVIEDFIKRLQGETGIDAAVVARLRKTLIDEQEASVDALRTALFSEEPLP